MFRSITKKFATSALALSLVSTSLTVNLVQPREAHAILGLSTGFVPWVFGGAGLITGGALMVGMGAAAGPSFEPVSGLQIAGGVLGILWGVVLLDGSQGAGVQYAPVTDAQADQLGLTRAERDAFNQNVEEINAIAESVASDLAHAQKPSLELSRQQWLAYGQALDADTLSAVQKVSADIAQKLNAASRAR